MLKSVLAAAIGGAIIIGGVATGQVAQAKAPAVVVCYQSEPGGGCIQVANLHRPQRLDMILADGSRTPYWSAREECDQSGGRLDSYKVKPKHGKAFTRFICRNVDY